MRRHRTRLALAASAVVGMAMATGAAPGEAQATIETGWWWKGNPGQSVQPPSPAPIVSLPVAPDGAPPPPNAQDGLMVAATADGASAIAAVRAVLDAQSLTLKVAENGDLGGANARLLACATTADWTPVKAGRWDNKPVVACDLSNGGASVAGIRSGDGSWVFPVQPLVEDGAIDVAIVPAASTAPGGVLEPFELVFKSPTLESFVVNEPLPDTDSESAFVPPPDDASAGDEFTTGLDGFDAGAVVGDESFAPVAAPALPRAEQAPRVLSPAATNAEDGGDAGGQAFAVLVVILVAGIAWFGAQQKAPPAPLSLIRVGARTRSGPSRVPTTGGLGRFERTRSGKPPSLF